MKKSRILKDKLLNKAYHHVMKRPKICKQAKKECLFMCSMASRTHGTIVEIGRNQGGSLLLMSIASPSSKVYSIDISSRYNRDVLKLCKQFKVPSKRYKIITNDSEEVAKEWNEDIDLLFIDGDHSTEAVYKDLVSWIPYVKPNGSILVHDYFPLSHTRRREVGPHDALMAYMSKYKSIGIKRVIQKMCMLKRINIQPPLPQGERIVPKH